MLLEQRTKSLLEQEVSNMAAAPENVVHSDDEFLDAVRRHEPAGTREVADEVGVTRQGADCRLRKLRDEGRVRSKKVGRDSLVWMLGESE